MSLGSGSLLSVVVIGLNEQDRLKTSLEAVFACRPANNELEVIYVDSGSTDRSVDIASAVPGVKVLRLEGARRSAAIARNAGLRAARGRFVQLIDGDSVVQPGWMESALDLLESAPDVACVFGQCVELDPDQSVYMKVCGLDWYIPPGDRRACGGNAMWRTATIAEQGYFDESLPAGEEPELCYRVRHQGGRVVCLDSAMVTHDLAMRRFGDYWSRAVRSGRGYAAIAARFRKSPEKLWLREAVVNFVEPVGWLVIFLIGYAVASVLGGIGLLLAWCLARAAKIALGVMPRGLSFRDGLLYGLHCQFVRLPVAIGQLKTVFGRA